MHFTQITALVALLSASAMGVALPEDGGDAPKGQAPHTGSDTGHNNCGPSTINPATGNGPKPEYNDCHTLAQNIGRADKSYRIRGDKGPRQIGYFGTCQFTATVQRPQQAWLGCNDVEDLIGSSLQQWDKFPNGCGGTILTGNGGEVPCDNVKDGGPVTVYWTLSYYHQGN